MKFYYDDIKNYLPLTPAEWKKLPRLLTQRSFESVPQEDGSIDADILSNRFADAANFYGFSREAGVITDKKVHSLKTSFDEMDRPARNAAQILVQSDRVLHYFGRVMTGVAQKNVGDICATNARYGMRETFPLVDISNFVMLETGEPTHIFDLDKVSGKKIIVRMAQKGEHFVALDRRTFVLDEESLVIADEEGVIALAGIIGSLRTAVDEKTKNIFIEAAVFDQKTIYQSQRRLGVATEASRRFEKNLSPYRAFLALQRITHLVQKYCSGNPLAGYLSNRALQPQPKISYDPRQLEAYAGFPVPLSGAKKILVSLGCQVEAEGKNLLVAPPADRSDIRIPVDVTEEVLRIVGYDRVGSTLPRRSGPAEEHPLLALEDRTRAAIIAMPFLEVITYEFVKSTDKALFPEIQLIEIANPLSDEYRYFRPSLFLSLIDGFADRPASDAQIYEIGRTATGTRGIVSECRALGVAVARSSDQDALFAGKGYIETLCDRLGIPPVRLMEFSKAPSILPKDAFRKGAEIMSNGSQIGICGVVSREMLSSRGVKQHIFFAELDLEMILSSMSDTERMYRESSRFPAVTRDVSFFLAEYKKVGDLVEALKSTSALIESISLLDVFQKEERTSYTFRLTLRSTDKTLTGAEADTEMSKVTSAIKKIGGAVR